MKRIQAREIRIITMLAMRPHTRHELGELVGAANIPQHVLVLRRNGWLIECDRIRFQDRDGKPCRPGLYRFASEEERLRAEGFLKGEAPATVVTGSEGPKEDANANTTANDEGAQHERAS
jgi:hypothetical protein